VISGNSVAGIEMSGAGPNNFVEGNFIGTNAAGSAALANGIGVYMTGAAFQNIIGGITPATRNVISGNSNAGILFASLSSSNAVEGDLIGTDASGTSAVGNSDGISMTNASNAIGGTVAGASNVISGNVRGIAIINANASIVQGNLIGTDITGTAAVGNQIGVYIASGAGSNLIGGTTASAANVISGNTSYGVNITGTGTTANLVQGNLIGTDVHGTAPLANLVDGVKIDSCAVNNSIGGTGAGAGNSIAYNPKGVVVVGIASTGNAIESNSIFSNTALGIDLNDDGVTPNTPGGPHAGPNDLQNYPVLTGVVFGGNNVTIHGTLNSAANAAFRLEFFSNPACDPSGHGQGRSFLGFQNVSTDASGNVSFNAGFSATNAQVTATATDPAGNTSEFSACGQPDYALTNVTGSNLRVRLGKPFTFVVASFTDTDPSGSAGQFSTTTINWGDGTASTSAQIVPLGSQNYNVIGTHTYAKVGAWTVTVTINDSGGATATATSKVRLWPKPLSY